MADIIPVPSRTPPNHHFMAVPSAEELRRLFDRTLQMLCIAGIDGYFKYVNPAFETTLGYTTEELVSQSFIEFVHPDDREATLAEIEKLSKGTATIRFENRYRCTDGSYRWLLWTSYPALDDSLLYATAMDVTDRKSAETEIETNLHIQHAVSSILRVFLESTSLEDQLHRCLEVITATPWITFQSSGSIYLVEENPDVLVMKAHIGIPTPLQNSCREIPLGKCLCGRAGARRQIVFVDRMDSRHEMRCKCIPGHGHYCVPIVSDGALHGVLNLYVEPGHEKKSQEMRFLSSVADVLAGVVRHKRMEASLKRRESELIAARRIQEHLLPNAPEVPGFDIAGASYPCDYAGGDYFDYFTLPDQSLGITIADVSGHGIAAALLAAATHTLLRSLANHHTKIDEILGIANSVLLEETQDDHFVTLLLGRLDHRSRSFSYTSAGHQTGYLIGRSGKVKARLESTGFPLAILPDTDFPICNPMPLESGDTILFLTDGILEARSPEGIPFGEKRTLEIVLGNRDRSAREIVENLYQDVNAFVQPNSATDDITAVVIKVESNS